MDTATGFVSSIPSRSEFFEQEVVGRDNFRPFGITWDSNHLYVANNNQIVKLDKELKFKSLERDVLAPNVHQIASDGRLIWAVSPWTNSIIRLSLPDLSFHSELPLLAQQPVSQVSMRGSETNDIHHYNSICISDGWVRVAAHNFEQPSFMLSFREGSSQSWKQALDIGRQVHSIASDATGTYWLSSAERTIIKDREVLFQIETTRFPRGFAVTNSIIVVGLSDFLSRGERVKGNSSILLIDRVSLEKVCELELKDTGGINDLRALDEFDYSHNLRPFL